MKRYRVLGMDFDSRSTILAHEIGEHWEEGVKQLWIQNKDNIKEGLLYGYGISHYKQKRQNFVDLKAKPFSVIAFHNTFLSDCRDAFTIGAYYPALTGVCALGERILNHLVLLLRDDYKATPEYKSVYRKDSFDNWKLAIDTLSAWDVLLPKVVDAYRKLEIIRNKAIHFRPETETNDRELALEAIHLLQEIVQDQFGAFGTQPWFIQTIPGEAYIKKAYQAVPFIKKVYLPNCVLVGSKHNLENVNGSWVAHDDFVYEATDISDEQFAEARTRK